MAFTGAMSGAMSPQPATQGIGTPPDMKGMPPPPTGEGKMPTGGSATSKEAAGGAFISAARDLVGWVPALSGPVNDLIAQVKSATVPKGNAGPAVDQPGPIGAAQLDSSSLLDSGSSGSF